MGFSSAGEGCSGASPLFPKSWCGGSRLQLSSLGADCALSFLENHLPLRPLPKEPLSSSRLEDGEDGET